MATNINTHYGKNINWTVYRNGYNSFVCSLLLNGDAYDISGMVLKAYLRKPNSAANVLILSEGEGITNGGALGTITIVLTSEQFADLMRDRYFLVIEYTISEKTYPLLQGYLTITDETNPGDTTTSVTIPVSIEGTQVNMAVTIPVTDSEIPLSAFATELTFNRDQELSTVTGGTRTFTLSASGHKNGVGIIARINEPSSVTFPDSFIKSEKSDDISSEHLNHIIMIYKEKWDGENDKVVYLITNETAI